MQVNDITLSLKVVVNTLLPWLFFSIFNVRCNLKIQNNNVKERSKRIYILYSIVRFVVEHGLCILKENPSLDTKLLSNSTLKCV